MLGDRLEEHATGFRRYASECTGIHRCMPWYSYGCSLFLKGFSSSLCTEGHKILFNALRCRPPRFALVLSMNSVGYVSSIAQILSPYVLITNATSISIKNYNVKEIWSLGNCTVDREAVFITHWGDSAFGSRQFTALVTSLTLWSFTLFVIRFVWPEISLFNTFSPKWQKGPSTKFSLLCNSQLHGRVKQSL